mgnify:CR=1 FL=1
MVCKEHQGLYGCYYENSCENVSYEVRNFKDLTF